MNPSHKQAFKGKTEQRKEQNFNIKQNFTGVTRTDANAAFLALHCRSIPGLLDCRPLNMDYNTVLWSHMLKSHVIKHKTLLGWSEARNKPPRTGLTWCVRRFYCFCSDLITEYSSMICEDMLLPSFLTEYRSVGWWKTIPPPLFSK